MCLFSICGLKKEQEEQVEYFVPNVAFDVTLKWNLKFYRTEGVWIIQKFDRVIGLNFQVRPLICDVTTTKSILSTKEHGKALETQGTNAEEMWFLAWNVLY